MSEENSTSQQSGNNNLLLNIIVAAVMGTSAGAGMQQISLPDLERRQDQCESDHAANKQRVGDLERRVDMMEGHFYQFQRPSGKRQAAKNGRSVNLSRDGIEAK